MLALLSPYRLLIQIIVIGGLALGAIWGIHEFLESQQQKGYDKAVGEYNEKARLAKEATQEREKLLREIVSVAQKEGNEREQTIRDMAATTVAASAGLRDTLAHIRRNSNAGTSVETLAHTVGTLTTVFDDCQTRYRSLAETADRTASDVKTLSDAWPVAPVAAKPPK